ncbi:MAG: amidohydrolase family protein [Nitrososphaerota archaeon]|nr:amidohydrolase family protein [Nitrososphaerota archaeon]MDG6932947.1 amidohydrolase family protein [Nitrososphaerota archaeon]MDG6935758.1 amidohydrolase family protein [Nitrososphaerota archaeon]MDG6944162.1 amidohydrolase family protein [Nitrososphaerota archaeon]
MNNIAIFKGRTFDGERFFENAEIGINAATGLIDHVDELHSKALNDITLMPGLIDTHIHFFGTDSPRLMDWVLTSDALLAVKSVYDAESLLESGFTTVRTMGDKVSLDLSRAEKLGILRGPRIISSGYSIAATGGNDDPKFLPYELSKQFSYSYYCDGPWECRKAVRLNVRNGAESIKAYASSSFVGGGEIRNELTPEELSAIADEAHAAHLKAAAHAYGSSAIQNTIDAGFDSVEHGLGLTEEQAELMRKRGIFYVPTLSTYKLSENSYEERREVIARHFEKEVSIASNAGVKIAAGTDLLGTASKPLGLNSLEIIYLSEIIGAESALKSATSLAAECLGLKNTGSIKAGYRADIIAVNGNPLQNASSMKRENVLLVVKGGKTVKNQLNSLP